MAEVLCVSALRSAVPVGLWPAGSCAISHVHHTYSCRCGDSRHVGPERRVRGSRLSRNFTHFSFQSRVESTLSQCH